MKSRAIEVSLLIFVLAICGVMNSFAQETRMAVIVVYDDIKSTTAIQNWVNEIANLNYNAIAIHARFRGDATYFPNKYYNT
ncbi:MAG TPA: hypothetical protein PLS31_09825, partial [Candidatus Sumerlaeota bacterium]|nr:hypothetical protein [Candidatus Sumerlaeota bacterium]